MATQFPGDQSAGMLDRIKRLLTAPAAEWARIEAEPMTVRGIFTSWVVPLAAIGPVAGLIRSLLFGYGVLGFSYRPSVASAVLTAAMMYVVALVAIYVLALIVNMLAPSFGGVRNPVAAMKVVAFSWTAAWLAGIFQIIPGLWWLGLLGLYSFYLLWIGLPMLMKSPADRATPYVAMAIVIAIVASAVISGAASSISWSIARPVLSADTGTVGGKVTVPGMGQVDLGKLEAASKRMEAMTAKAQADAANGTSSAVPAAALQAMLPASIGGFTRGDVESASGGAGGFNGSRAEGRYTAGDQSFTLSVADAGAMGALATLGGALNVQSNKQTATGYEKTEMVGGSMVNEKWNTDSNSGSYQTMVASRFIVAADGRAPGIDTLKQAVASIDTGKLARLAK